MCFSSRILVFSVCILVRGLRSYVWAKHCRQTYPQCDLLFIGKERIKIKFVVCSANFPGDADDARPTQKVIHGGGDLLGFLGMKNLGISNVGCKPAYRS